MPQSLFDDDEIDDATCAEPPRTAEEIRRRCLAIQEGWSPREERKRAGTAGWLPPAVTVAEMGD